MKKAYGFKYGEGLHELFLDSENIIQELQAKEIKPLENVAQEVERLLDSPTASAPFNTLFEVWG